MGGDALGLSKKLLLAVLEEELLPLTAHFAHKLVSAKRESRVHAPALRSSLKLLSKSLLHYMPQLAAEAGFPDLWARLLQLMQVCCPRPTQLPLWAVSSISFLGFRSIGCLGQQHI